MTDRPGDLSDPALRHCPNRPFPAYAFVPGMHPHPKSDPQGHSFGNEPAKPPCDPEHPTFREEFLFGIDLFNAGFYWEAHEAWECLWIACGRRGHWATTLQGLIKLAAAGVKAREGNATGVSRHATRAVELLSEAAAEKYGLDNRDEISQFAKQLSESPLVDTTPSTTGRVVFSLRLVPSITLAEPGFQ